MKIVQLIPGAGGAFYCENCVRDGGLCRALRRLGHDVFMVPLYLPPSEDAGPEPAGAQVFYGGINVYLQQKLALFRHTPRWLDRFFDAPALLRWAGGKAGMTGAEDLADTTLSMLRGAEGRQAKELNRLVAWLKSAERPDVVCLSNALLLGLAPKLRAELGAPVVCLLQDEDIFLDGLPEAQRKAAWDLMAARARGVDAFVASSRYYRDAMAHALRLPPERIGVVYPGMDPEGYAPSAAPADPPAIGFLERMCPEKGLDTLVDAFLLLKRKDAFRNARLRVSGGRTAADNAFVAECRRRIARAGAEADVEFAKSFDRESRIRFLQGLSVLSVPARHKDAFGLYNLEALAAGVPVVLPPHGGFPEVVEETGGGVLCRRNDPESLADALAELLADPARARELGRRGRQQVLERFNAERMAAEFAAVCESLQA